MDTSISHWAESLETVCSSRCVQPVACGSHVYQVG